MLVEGEIANAHSGGSRKSFVGGRNGLRRERPGESPQERAVNRNGGGRILTIRPGTRKGKAEESILRGNPPR